MWYDVMTDDSPNHEFCYRYKLSFLCRLRSIVTHRDHFVRRPSVCLSVCSSVTLFCHTFQSYVSQATHAFLRMLPLFLSFILIANTTNNKNVTFHEVWTVISSLIKIIGKEHDFLQNFAYILWRIIPETIFNQKQVLQGIIFIIYSYCKYNKLYVRQILWSLNHNFQRYCNFWIFRGLF